MTASGNMNPGSEVFKDERLKKFLNFCVSSVANEPIRAGDIRGFLEETNLNQDVKKILTFASPDVILRLFFPNAQLPLPHRLFLKDTLFVFRSRTPLYTYQHSSGPRARYEIKMDLMGLFLLINYNVIFRVFSVPFANNIGQWHSLGDRFIDKHTPDGNLIAPDYDLQIIPPHGMSFSLLLELLPDMKDAAKAFNITSVLQQDFNPVQQGTQLLNLQDAIRSKLSSLEADVRQTISQVYETLVPASQSLAVSELPQQLLDNEEEKKQPENSTPAIETPDEKALSIINSFPASFTTLIPEMFTVKNSLMTMKSPLSIEKFPVKHVIINTFYNIFFYTSLFSLSKKHELRLGAAAQSHPFKDPESTPSNLLEIWLSGILTAVSMDESHEWVETNMNRIFMLIDNSHTSKWFLREEKNCSIPVEAFSQILSNIDVITLQNAMGNYQQFVDRIDEIDKFKNTSTRDLLEIIYEDSHPIAFIRKLARLNTQKLLDEFGINISQSNHDHDPNLRVRPATMVQPMSAEMGVKTYGGFWQNSSGVFLVAESSTIAIAGYKYAAHSHSLNGDKSQIFGFPYHAEIVLRPQGGKPSYNYSDMSARLKIIRLRANGILPDISRKAFLEMYFEEYMLTYPQHSRIIETVLLGMTNHEEDCQSKITQAQDLAHLRAYLCSKLDSRLTDLSFALNVKNFYMKLFDDIVRDAIKNQLYLMYTLRLRMKQSYNNKIEYIKRNINYAKSNLNAQQIESLAAAGKHYRTYPLPKLTASNEILLQGIRIINNKEAEPFVVLYYFMGFTKIDRIQSVLQKRLGNIQAIYANVTLVDGKPNATGISEAIQIQKFVSDHFNQILPFVIYNEDNGACKFLSLESFMNDYGNSVINLNEKKASQNPVVPLNVSSSSSSIQSLLPAPLTHEITPVKLPLTKVHVYSNGSIKWAWKMDMIQEQINYLPAHAFTNNLKALNLPLVLGDIVTLKFELNIYIVCNHLAISSTYLKCTIENQKITKANFLNWGSVYIPSWQQVKSEKPLAETFNILLQEVLVKANIDPNTYYLECNVLFEEIKINDNWVQLQTAEKRDPPHPPSITQSILGYSKTRPFVVWSTAAIASQQAITPARVIKRSSNVLYSSSSFSSPLLAASSSSSTAPVAQSSSSTSISPSSKTTRLKKQKTSSTNQTQVSQGGIFSAAVTTLPASNSSGSNMFNANSISKP